MALNSPPSVPPEILEPVRRQLCVPNGVLNIAISEVRLQGAGVMAGVCEGETGMAQHVRVRLEIEAGFRASCRERRAALAGEDVGGRGRLFTL
jgi:hypothetical protein